jgi:hypothetical protein
MGEAIGELAGLERGLVHLIDTKVHFTLLGGRFWLWILWWAFSAVMRDDERDEHILLAFYFVFSLDGWLLLNLFDTPTTYVLLSIGKRTSTLGQRDMIGTA